MVITVLYLTPNYSFLSLAFVSCSKRASSSLVLAPFDFITPQGQMSIDPNLQGRTYRTKYECCQVKGDIRKAAFGIKSVPCYNLWTKCILSPQTKQALSICSIHYLLTCLTPKIFRSFPFFSDCAISFISFSSQK